jgi:very-short-patch-repair endonuclease
VSDLESAFLVACRQLGLPEPEREFRFAPPRRWRADFAWPTLRVLVEIEGGIWTGGRHTRGSGFEADMAKYNAAALAGWTVLRFGGTAIKSGNAARMTALALNQRAAA